MAEGSGGEGGATFSRVLKNLEADVTCGICFDQYRQPKLLPCAHYFCRRCVKRVAEHARGKPFPCPVCNEMTTLPLGGVDDMPTAFFVQHLLEVHRAIDANKEELRGPRKMTCDSCKKGDDGVVVASFCKECDQFLCGDCLKGHQLTSLYSGHQVMSLEELRARRKTGGRNMSFRVRTESVTSYADLPRRGGSFQRGDDKTKVYAMCPRHPDERLKLYCHDHDAIICGDCIVFDHPRDQCRTGFIRDEAPKARQVLGDALAPIQSAHESISAAETDLEAVHDKISADEVAQCEEVRRAFGEIRKSVENCETALLEAVQSVSEGKKDALQGQKKALQISKQGVESTIEGVKQDIENFTDEEVLQAHRELLMKMEKEAGQHRLRTLDPVTHADLVRVGPSLDDFPMKLGLAYPRLDLFHLKIKPPTVMHVGSKVDYEITVPHSMDGEVKVEVQSLIDPGCVITAVVKVKKGRGEVLRGVVVVKYSISFTPRVRGPHKLTTKVNGQELPGSPFDVFSLIHPSHLGFVVRQSGDAGYPFGIALSPEGLLVTAGNGSKSLQFWSSRDLKEVGDPIYCPMFHYPRGVAFGPDPGVVYSSDKGADKTRDYIIMKFVNGVLERGVTYPNRTVRFIKVIRGQLFVADGNTSQVRRYSLDTLDHIGSFTVPRGGTVHDIAEFNDELYVVTGVRVARYSFYEWNFLGNVPLAVAMTIMRGICFDRGGHMFITQEAPPEVKGVYVFDPMSGALVTRFGQFIECPLGIVIDDDGFVYITDHKPTNRRIFAF